MLKAAIVGALALAVTGVSFAQAEGVAGSGGRYSVQASADAAVDYKISRAKAALQLTTEQERHWPRVAVALRHVAAEQDKVQEASAGGIVSRVSNSVLSAASLRRLETAARPLLDSLSDGQKQVARQMARAMGLGSIADRFE